MLTAPAIAEVDGVTIWGDDTDFFRCYLTSANPRVRLDDDGDPVFLLVQYDISEDERAADPKLPAGGGFMNFDVTFSVTPAEEQAARNLMQPRVEAEWQRRRTGTAEERNSRGVKGTTEAPAVEFGPPTYTRGTVQMFAPQSELLVDAQVAQGEPDLLAGNTAVFSIDLTAAGSEFMRTTLTEGSGSDLTPIQVVYKLAFMARLPPVDIYVHADSSRIYEQTRKYMDGEGRDVCTTYDFQNTDITASTAELMGMIEVKIDPGSSAVNDEVLQELRQYALDMMQQQIENRFFTEDPSDAYFTQFPDGAPDEFLEEEGKNNKKNKNSKKYLRKISDASSIDLTLSLKQHSVVDWAINPQSTLQTFFSDHPPAQISQFVRRVRTGSPFFQSLNLHVRVFADYDGTELEAAEVALDYSGLDLDGQRREAHKVLTFTSTAEQVWDAALIGTKREVEYRMRTKLVGHDFGPFSPVKRTSANAINLSIPTPGRVQRTVSQGLLDFAALELASVEVTLRYQDAANGVPLHESIVALNAATPSADFTVETGIDETQPVLYRRKFKFKNNDVIEDDRFTESRANLILIDTPFRATLAVRLLPVGRGWGEVVQTQVELFYDDDDNAFHAHTVITLKSNQDTREWVVRLRDPAKTGYRFRVNTSYANGDLEESGLLDGSGSGVLPIEVRAPRETEIVIVPSRLDFDSTIDCEVVLTHEASNTVKAFIFEDKERQSWTVPVRPGDPLSYTARVTHHLRDGDDVVLDPITETDNAFVIPPYRAPEPGSLTYTVMPTLVDFQKTPLVVVDLVYEDEANDVQESTSLAFTRKDETQTWTVPAKDRNRRLIRQVTKYFAAPDNTLHESPPAFQSTNLIVLQPFVPAIV